ncbi:MAG: hypothetical protein AAFP98_01945 [Pseudomonadota bacterium]
MGDHWGRRSQLGMLGLGAALATFGLIWAAPHLMLSYQLGLALCGAEGGLGGPLAFALAFSKHCWGCVVAMVGFVQMAAVLLTNWQGAASNRHLRQSHSFGNTASFCG